MDVKYLVQILSKYYSAISGKEDEIVKQIMINRSAQIGDFLINDTGVFFEERGNFRCVCQLEGIENNLMGLICSLSLDKNDVKMIKVDFLKNYYGLSEPEVRNYFNKLIDNEYYNNNVSINEFVDGKLNLEVDNEFYKLHLVSNNKYITLCGGKMQDYQMYYLNMIYYCLMKQKFESLKILPLDNLTSETYLSLFGMFSLNLQPKINDIQKNRKI